MIRRIKIGDALNIATTGAGKIVFSSGKTPGVHYTINLGGKSGVFDVHKTTEVPERSYETLGACKPEEFIAALEPVALKLVGELHTALRPLRLGWLHHNHIDIFSGLFPNIDCPAVKKKGRTLEL